MTTLTQRASYGTVSVQKKPKLNSAFFGDGYEQRAAKGINNNPKTWTVSFANLTDATATALMDFFDAANGVSSFTWVDLKGVSGKYTCKEYSQTFTDEDKNTVNATLNQVYGE